jgi:ABC-type nitrate/sulfonate/bicarbonate transport system substrate-binding protein
MAMAGMALVQPAAAQSAAQPFKVVAFAGSSNLPIWLGQIQGIFAKRGLNVTVDITPNSVEMARNLEAQKYELALTSIDNIVAYDEGQGEAGLGKVDFVALFGVDDGMLSLIVAKSVPSIQAIKGQKVAVDAATTGFAFVLRAMLSHAGVTDYSFVKVGGGAQRLAALLDGSQTITLLNTPLDIAAEAHGFKSLGRASDIIGPYQGIVAAVKRDRVAPDRAQLVAFARGFHESVMYLMDPAHRAQAIGLLKTRMKMSDADAARAYAALVDKRHGIFRSGRVSVAGVKTVLKLRTQYAEPHKELHAPAYYIDDSIRKVALAKK